MSQSNVQEGKFPVLASEALTADLIVTLINDTNVLKAALPNSATDEAIGVVVDTVASGDYVDIQPLDPNKSVRLKLSGTCLPAAQLVLATPDGTVDGKVVTLPTTPGTYRLVAIAEEVGVDGQSLRARPVGSRLITVT